MFIVYSINLILFLSFSEPEILLNNVGNDDIYLIDQEEPIATAIFWIDKKSQNRSKKLHVKTVKAKVNLRPDGKVLIISFVKPQPVNVERYIRKHTKTFNAKRMIDNSYLKPGEQYVQLRYLPEKIIF